MSRRALHVLRPGITRNLGSSGPSGRLWVNVPVVAVGLVAGSFLISESRVEGDNRYDVLGTVLVVGGLGALVYGLTLAEHSWTAPATVACLAGSVVLLVGLSVFTTIYVGTLPTVGAPGPADLVDGYSAVFVAAAVTMALGAVLAFVLVRGPKERLLPSGDQAVVHLG